MVPVSGVIENIFPVPCVILIEWKFETTIKDLENISGNKKGREITFWIT